MSEIVKTCKTHGDLVESECHKYKRMRADGSPYLYLYCSYCSKENNQFDWTSIIGDGPLRCSTCKSYLPQSAFMPTAIHQKFPRCRTCRYNLEKRTRSKCPKKLEKRRIARLHHSRKPETKLKRIKRDLESKFNITYEDYVKLRRYQKNQCAICSNKLSSYDSRQKVQRRLSLDHCHKTNKVRGLLCNQCNLGLGFFKDSIDLFEAAIKYLKAHPFDGPNDN